MYKTHYKCFNRIHPRPKAQILATDEDELEGVIMRAARFSKRKTRRDTIATIQ